MNGTEELNGKVAIVTGGIQGIGLGIAERLGAAGARVAIINRNLESGLAAQQLLTDKGIEGIEAIAVQGDVSVPEDVQHLHDETLAAFGAIHILVNNAAIIAVGQILDTDLEEWQRVLNINLTGAFLCAQVAGRTMKAAGGGRIINVTSPVTDLAVADYGTYTVSKAGMVSLTRVLAVELGKDNITVNAVSPHMIKTPMNTPLLEGDSELRQLFVDEIPRGRHGKVEEVADLVHFLASDAASYLTGQVIHLDGGWTHTRMRKLPE